MLSKSWAQVSVVFYLKSKYGFKRSLRLVEGEKETSRSEIRTHSVLLALWFLPLNTPYPATRGATVLYPCMVYDCGPKSTLEIKVLLQFEKKKKRVHSVACLDPSKVHSEHEWKSPNETYCLTHCSFKGLLGAIRQENSRIFGSVCASVGAEVLLALKNLHLPWQLTRTPNRWLDPRTGSLNSRAIQLRLADHLT